MGSGLRLRQADWLRLVPDASPELRAIFGASQGRVLAPVRAEIFGAQRFAQHGQSLGLTHLRVRAKPREAIFFPRLLENLRWLRLAHTYIGAQADVAADLGPAAEWLLDNFHLVEAQLQAVHEGLPRSYFRSLPALCDEPLVGLPRVYGVAWAFVAHTDSAFDESLLVSYLGAYQQACELHLAELWALPTTLRVVLIENLRRLAERLALDQAAREVANLCCDQIQRCSVAGLTEVAEQLGQRGLADAFLAQMAQRLQDHGTGTRMPSPAAIQTWLTQALPDPVAVQARRSAEQTADNLSVSNAVTALRSIGDADWSEVVGHTSPLMHSLLATPLFAAEDSATRDRTLHAIERLARRAKRGELAVAQALLALMRGPADAPAPDLAQPRSRASFWLHGPGRAALYRALGLGLSWRPAGLASARRLALPAYLGLLGAGSLGLSAWLLLHLGTGSGPGPAPGWPAWLVGLLMLVPSSEALVAVVNRLISESTPPRHQPRLSLADGIPAEQRVMVVIPAMLSNPAAVTELVHRLHLHALANPERHTQFALLSDWSDADSPHLESDAALLAQARAAIRALNQRPEGPLPQGDAAPRFVLLHRQRQFSVSEQRWIGWERKRGKLEQLIAALVCAPDGSADAQAAAALAPAAGAAFADLGQESCLAAGTRHLLTLDSDTQLPPGRLRELVGVAAHPDNQPRLDPSGQRVVAGYAILQPRLVTPLPAAGQATPFHWLFAGQCGIDPYSAASSEVYQDLFGEGSFTGKGLLNVATLHAVLGGRLPEGTVLSHDLLEGSLVRCATLSDVALIEEAPFHADVAAARLHRWMRGDWQLLPFLLHPKRWPLRGVNRWKMLDNLRRSLVAPCALTLLLLAMLGVGLTPLAAFVLVLAAYSAGPLIGAVAGLAPSRDDLAKGHFYRLALTDLARALAGSVWHMVQLPRMAGLSADAIARSLWRMAVSRRHLLQWTTAAATQAAASTRLAQSWQRHRASSLLALALLAAALWAHASGRLDLPSPVALTTLCLLWASLPLLSWWLSRPRPRSAALPEPDLAWCAELARQTWGYFERSVGPDDHHLPPDNLQTSPHDLLARRTSPTNIGLYLLSAACAQRFGWISTADLLQRLEATLATLSGLDRHRGHFLNWYDTARATPLLPLYVSTVDSGNLSGHLLALAQACRELAAQAEQLPDRSPGTTPDQAIRLLAVADRSEHFAWAADFEFLYHRKRHLLHIGYRVAEQQLDPSFYDLLASESRLTSLLAIAKGDVPVRHWLALGRPYFAVRSLAALRSWSGSMFEYLMPGLVLDEPRGGALQQANLAAVREQMRFGQQRGVPWGVSESCHAGRDAGLVYQYAPHGVPRLALRRTPPDDLVIAPYASALALGLDPAAARANLGQLQALGARGAWGFVEALDFSPIRQIDLAAPEALAGPRFTPVNTYMAHHQGMSLVALANLLLGGVAQRWGMAHPSIQAVASLLHEREPREVSVLSAPSPGPALRSLLDDAANAPALLREMLPAEQAVSPTHLLSNGHYHVALLANGAGYSQRGAQGITRWRDDALRSALGSFGFIRRGQSQTLASLSQHPAPDPQALYQAQFHADRVVLLATWPDLAARTTVWVSPEDDIEFRQVELRNLGSVALDLELISACEPTLCEQRADQAHPAFAKMFLRAEWRPGVQALVFERAPRLAGEPGLHSAHFIAPHEESSPTGKAEHPKAPDHDSLRLQTDRARWLGRNRDPSRPQAELQLPPPAPDGAEGVALNTGLDPVAVLGLRLHIAPGAKHTLTLATAAADDANTLRAVIDKYRQPSHVRRASMMSATHAGIRLRDLGLSAEDFVAIPTLTSALVHSLTRSAAGSGAGSGASLDGGSDTPARDGSDAGATEVCDRRLLHRFGLSGERPLVLVSAGTAQALGLLRSLAKALRLWAWGGLACDLVVVDTEPASYAMHLQPALVALRERHLADRPAGNAATATTPIGFYLLRADGLSPAELGTLRSVARLRLNADARPLARQAQGLGQRYDQALANRRRWAGAALVTSAPAGPVAAPHGQFAADGGEFSFEVGARTRAARPWINVLANPDLGCLVGEAGGGYTWAGNSRLNQLTPWTNDPVADPPGEHFWLQDLRRRTAWSLTPSATGDAALSYRVSHGQGASRIHHRQGELDVELTWCVDADSAVKRVRVVLVNRGQARLQLRLVGMVEWLLGAVSADRNTLHLARLGQAGAQAGAQAGVTVLLATQREHSAGFGGGTAFWASAQPSKDVEARGAAEVRRDADAQANAEARGAADDAATGNDSDAMDWTCDRREFFDQRGRITVPRRLGRTHGGGLDPCAALAQTVNLAGGDSAERVFVLGYAASPAAAQALALAALAQSAPAQERTARQAWDALLGACQVSTPDPRFDALVNRWLLYQAVACRLWGKAGFYQAGGANGYRDQLQDTLALAWAAPALLRAQIVLCAQRQFSPGDVQHWWHMPLGAGVRTHFSDDLLWLPLACSHYLRATGDAGLLDQRVPFLAGADIPPGAEDSYFAPTVSDELASVYEHAARSIDHSLRVGVHGLPLMGSGDWNDGMNRVGAGGRGESVWLGWFLCQVVSDFIPQAQARGEAERVARWTLALQGWRAALLGPGWDGQWFRRAYFDDASPLGSAGNAEAKIDLIAQAWAVLSGQAPPDKAHQSLASVKAHLADESAGLLRLLDPPFVHSDPSPGYIQAYPPGVRENGGQYTHGGVWAVMAQAALGTDPDLAWRWFTWLSPAHRAADPLHGPVYGLEPYAVAGDVYSQPPHTGRGGWSWYTGAASWLHRAAVESIFGLSLQATTLSFRPSLPSHWPRAELTLRRDGRVMRFMLVRATPAQALAAAAPSGADADASLLLPGQPLAWTTLPAHSCFVLPLLAGAATEAGSAVADSVRSPPVRSIGTAPSVVADQA